MSMVFYWKKESFIHGERDSGHQQVGYENIPKACYFLLLIPIQRVQYSKMVE